MKVLSFNQFYGLSPEEKREYYVKTTGALFTWGRDEHSKVIIRLNDWYYNKTVKLDFKPELITELFEGWKNSGASESYTGLHSAQAYFHKKTRTYLLKVYIPGIKRHNAYTMFVPRTLDDFITDCQRAGIELEWRIK